MAHDILIVDDEGDIRMLTAGILEDEGYDTRAAATSNEALSAVRERRPSLILLDIWLQGSELDGLQILKAVKKDHPDVPVVMMSGHGTVETAVSAIKDGAYDFIEKPFKADRMVLIVERAIEAARLRRENEELRLRAGPDSELLGRSSAISHVRQAIERVAPANSRVLISGPSGSGKEVAARMLHAHSRRAGGPFVVVNCAMMRPDTVEAELFGVERVGDVPARIGTFETAHGGTLFLDEVGDMPMETQRKIVRVLQEQTFQRVGGSQQVKVDVRVVAGSTADLNEAMADGRFREDLFYRLSVVPIAVPPLVDRRDDIPDLALEFMRRTADALRQPARDIADDALAALQTYDWPGNVRELRNVIERIAIMTPPGASAITAEMLPGEITGLQPATVEWSGAARVMGLPLRDAREQFEKEYLTVQVARFGGNISRTAEFIGMERSALHRKLRSLGIAGDGKGRG